MKRRVVVSTPLFLLVLLLGVTTVAVGQVATLRTPDPEAESTEAPAAEVDGQDAILAFVACLRENGIDVPDPQFGAEGTRFGLDPEALARIDLMSREFLDAMEACQDLLAALQPELDPAQVAEQNEQLLAFAECMRAEGIDFPDPDPVRGYTFASMRGDDGELLIDPFSVDFLSASTACVDELDLDVPGAPGS
jgi:hypothetical protein